MPHRRILAALFVFAFLAPAAAGAASIEKGVKAGVNLANFRGEFADIAHPKAKAGFVVGAFVAFGFAPDLAIQVEGLFSMKGAKGTGSNGGATGNYTGAFENTIDLRYLEVPMLLRGTLLRTAVVQPMYCLGPAIGISLGGKAQSDAPVRRDRDLTDLKAVDIGLALGGGAGFKVGGKKILTEIRYTTGFGDIYDIEDNAESINHVFSLTAALAF
jgi:hypothetical protein